MQLLQAEFQALTIDGTNYLLAAGTSDVNSDYIDMDGFRHVSVVVEIGTIAASGAVTCSLTQCATSGGSYTAVTGATSTVSADTDDNKLIVLDLLDVTQRYVKLSTVRADGGNSTINAAFAIKRGARKKPSAASATTLQRVSVVCP